MPGDDQWKLSVSCVCFVDQKWKLHAGSVSKRSLALTLSCMCPLLYSTGLSLIGLFIKQRGLVEQWIRPSTLLWHPMDITSFHIAARCVCIDKTSFVIKKLWAGDPV